MKRFKFEQKDSCDTNKEITQSIIDSYFMKKELALEDIEYLPYTEEQKRELRRQVRKVAEIKKKQGDREIDKYAKELGKKAEAYMFNLALNDELFGEDSEVYVPFEYDDYVNKCDLLIEIPDGIFLAVDFTVSTDRVELRSKLGDAYTHPLKEIKVPPYRIVRQGRFKDKPIIAVPVVLGLGEQTIQVIEDLLIERRKSIGLKRNERAKQKEREVIFYVRNLIVEQIIIHLEEQQTFLEPFMQEKMQRERESERRSSSQRSILLARQRTRQIKDKLSAYITIYKDIMRYFAKLRVERAKSSSFEKVKNLGAHRFLQSRIERQDLMRGYNL